MTRTYHIIRQNIGLRDSFIF